MSADAAVSYDQATGLWKAEANGTTVLDPSPSAALDRLERMGKVRLGHSRHEEWTTPNPPQ